jgi:hypothetical protein
LRYYGDIPEPHREILKELEMLESWFSKNGKRINPPQAAKGFVCMAHDYYHIYFDEEGERLLNVVESIVPGYFREMVWEHIESDLDFAHLVGQLVDTSGLFVMTSLGFEE